MNGIFWMLVLVAVGVQYGDCACTNATVALADMATCLDEKLSTLRTAEEAVMDAICKNATTIKSHVSSCAAAVADCPDADKQTGMQHERDAELKITQMCNANDKRKMCEAEIEKCTAPVLEEIEKLDVDVSLLMGGLYNASTQAEKCTLMEDVSFDEMYKCVKDAMEKDMCKMDEMMRDGQRNMSRPDQDGRHEMEFDQQETISMTVNSLEHICEDECKDLKTKMEKMRSCVSDSSYNLDMQYIYQKAVISKDPTELDTKCTSITTHVKSCFADFECCPIPMMAMRQPLKLFVPKTACPEMGKTLEEQCATDGDGKQKGGSDVTGNGEQMKASLVVLSAMLALWAFLRA